jgi:hypothetical protein
VTPTATIRPSERPAPTPEPTVHFLGVEDLADVDLYDERPTAVCDGDPNNAFLDAPESDIDCCNGLRFGFRAIRTRLASVDRLYLHRRSCAALPCTRLELDTVDVIGWKSDNAVSVTMTGAYDRITAPVEGAIAPWPSASSSTSPPIARPAIEGAPTAIRRREPFPYCGRQRPVDSGQSGERQVEINRCFIDGVLEARPVEMVFVPEVIREPILIRFDGTGFVEVWSARQGRRETCITLPAWVYFGFAC